MVVIKKSDPYIKCEKCRTEVSLWQCAERKASLDGWRIDGEGNYAKHYCPECSAKPEGRRETVFVLTRVMT